MPLFLSQRDLDTQEYIDDPDCDPRTLYNTYRQFRIINALLARMKPIYRNWIKPAMAEGRPYSLLDIGFGGGDIPLKLAAWARQEGHRLNVTAIEIDQRAFDYVQKHVSWPSEVAFKLTDTRTLVDEGARFDFVLSNHLLHHLDLQASEFYTMLSDAVRLSRKRALFIDVERSDLAYLLFALAAKPFFRHSFIYRDGLVSIKRSYTLQELSSVVPAGWQINRMFPFRLILSYTHNPASE